MGCIVQDDMWFGLEDGALTRSGWCCIMWLVLCYERKVERRGEKGGEAADLTLVKVVSLMMSSARWLMLLEVGPCVDLLLAGESCNQVETAELFCLSIPMCHLQ